MLMGGNKEEKKESGLKFEFVSNSLFSLASFICATNRGGSIMRKMSLSTFEKKSPELKARLNTPPRRRES